jgi:aspartyl/asparaginyl beta-hydroxylase (cupin superfamily)
MNVFGKEWINPAIYPELKLLIKHRGLILSELNQILKNENWCCWGYSKPTFTKLLPEEIIAIYSESTCTLANTQAWKIFGMILWGKVLETSEYCPNTMKLLNIINNNTIINAGFSCLEAGAETKKHQDINPLFYRVHFPLIIPDGDCYLEVGGIKRKWVINDNLLDLLIFDDTQYHNAWNYTDENRIVLIIDLKRK